MAGWRSREMEVRRNSLLNYPISEPANKKISGSVSRRFNGNTDQSGRSSKMAKMCLCLRPAAIRAPIQSGEKQHPKSWRLRMILKRSLRDEVLGCELVPHTDTRDQRMRLHLVC